MWPFVVAALGFVALAAITTVSVIGVQHVRQKRAAQQLAHSEMQRSAAETRERIADSIEKGETKGSDEAIGRLKEQLEKSANQLSGDDAAASRAMAAYLAKMQTQAHDYEAALGNLLEEHVLEFSLRDRATIEAHRKLLKNFATVNDRLTDTVRRAEELARAELTAARISPRMIEATMAGFNKGRFQRQLQLRIREHDRTLGEAGLAAIDLLDEHWGRWSRDEASGQLQFQDDATLETFNELMAKIQNAADKQTKVQQELVEQMRAMGRQ